MNLAEQVVAWWKEYSSNEDTIPKPNFVEEAESIINDASVTVNGWNINKVTTNKDMEGKTLTYWEATPDNCLIVDFTTKDAAIEFANKCCNGLDAKRNQDLIDKTLQSFRYNNKLYAYALIDNNNG